MRRTRTLAALFLMFLCVMVGHTRSLNASATEEMSSQQEDVWQMEEVYWQYVKALDVEGYKSLWHEDFVGWASFSDSPIGKANIGDWVQEYKNKGMSVTYELRPNDLTPYNWSSSGQHEAGESLQECLPPKGSM